MEVSFVSGDSVGRPLMSCVNWVIRIATWNQSRIGGNHAGWWLEIDTNATAIR
jgi:hypothetical protein